MCKSFLATGNEVCHPPFDVLAVIVGIYFRSFFIMAATFKTIDRKERETDEIVPPENHFMVRLCGVNFPKSCQKPFDPVMCDAFAKTSKDLLKRFNCINLAFTASDEILLNFPVRKSKRTGLCWQHLFAGRKHQLVSQLSSYASIRFNVHLRDTDYAESCPFFEARLIEFEHEWQALAYMLHEQRHRTYERGIKSIALLTHTQKELIKLRAGEVYAMLKSEGVDPGKFNLHTLYGTFIRRENYGDIQIRDLSKMKHSTAMLYVFER